jgi:YbbR domain-containing protein
MKRLLEKLLVILRERNIAAKLVCLVLAVVLWAYISSTKMGDLKYRIRVEFKNTPHTLVVTSPQNPYITVMVSGTKDLLKDVRPEKIKAFVNLDRAAAGEDQKFPVELTRTELPDNLSVGTATHRIGVTIEKRLVRRVHVVHRVTGDVQEGFIAGSPRAVPDSVTVSGAESIVAKMDAVYTKPVSIDKLVKTANRDAVLEAGDNGAITLDTQKVLVVVPVYPGKDLIKIEKKATVKDAGGRYRLSLPEDLVVLYVRKLQHDAEIEPEDFDVVIDPEVHTIAEQLEKGEEREMDKLCLVNAFQKSHFERVRLVLVVPDMIWVKIARKN